MPASPSQFPGDDDRIVIYREFAYRRFEDRVVAAAPAGNFETVPTASLPLPVARALGMIECAGPWTWIETS